MGKYPNMLPGINQSFSVLSLNSKTLVYATLLLAGLLACPTRASDWYRWRGPDANGISRETGWLVKWPDAGPRQLWKTSVGTGFSSMTVSGGRVYTMGNANNTDTIYCFDAKTGAPVWKHPYPTELDPKYYEGGPSATPAVDGDRVYAMSKKGDLFCLNSASGETVWSRNVHKELGAEIPTWGFAGSALVEGDLLILDVGSAGAALNKQTGKTVWFSGKGPSGYSTPVPFNSGQDRCVAILGSKALVAVKVADGKPLWSFPWVTLYDVNAADPVIADGKAFISSGYDHGCALLDISGGKPALLWQNKNMRNHFSSSVLWNGSIYGVDENELKCLALDTGEVKWSERTFGKGSVTLADGKLIALGEKGELFVADASPQVFKPVSRAQVLGGKCWTAPVLADGRIYCRNAKGDVVCLDVGGK
jgi:outer membrane protein assembly factor BamB